MIPESASSPFTDATIAVWGSEKLAEKNFRKSGLKTFEKPQHFRLSSPQITQLVMLQ
jgi:hypothetical protein